MVAFLIVWCKDFQLNLDNLKVSLNKIINFKRIFREKDPVKTEYKDQCCSVLVAQLIPQS